MLLVLLLLIHSNIGLREVLGTTPLLLGCHNMKKTHKKKFIK